MKKKKNLTWNIEKKPYREKASALYGVFIQFVGKESITGI